MCPLTVCVCVWMCVQMRRSCNLLCQHCQCYLCPNSINKYALERDTHSADKINSLHTNHHLRFQQQTHTQRCLTVLISRFTDINMSGGQFKWFTESSLSQMS